MHFDEYGFRRLLNLFWGGLPNSLKYFFRLSDKLAVLFNFGTLLSKSGFASLCPGNACLEVEIISNAVQRNADLRGPARLQYNK